MTKINTLAMPKEQYVQKIVLTGFAVLAVMVGMYMYFVGKIVFDVMARRNAESQIKLAQSAVGQLQVAYLGQLHNVDIESAAASGLFESHDTLYAVRDTDTSANTVGMLR